MNKKILYWIISLAVVAVATGIFIYQRTAKTKNAEVTEITATVSVTSIPTTKPKKDEPTIKSATYLRVPFTSQAPFANWDETHNEACEEAAIYIVHQYLDGDRRSKIPPAEADKEILKMVDWQVKNWRTHKDLTAKEIVDLAKGFYDYKNIEIKYNFSEDDIRQAIANNQPVIIPTAGRLLGNPNYRTPGPVYHALVIKGYDSSKVITNDPGTRKGQGYTYSWKTLMNAAHEWAGSGDNIQQGKQAMIVIYK